MFCFIDWTMTLEFVKVFLSWPPVVLIILVTFFCMFKGSILSLVERIKEIELPQTKITVDTGSKQQLVSKAEEELLPQELVGDPQAENAIAFVKSDPIKTVILYKELFKNFNFERVFNMIFGTQIELLEYLRIREHENSDVAELIPFYEKCIKISSFKEIPFSDYLNFLFSFHLIQKNEDQSVSITSHGLEFLSYIKTNYAYVWNKRNL